MARGFIGNRIGTAVTDGATGGQFSLDDNYYLMTRDTLNTPFVATGGNQANGTAPGNGYKYHTFTTSGSFVVSQGSEAVEVLCVGSGGGGGSNNNGGSDGGGGGGAGGVALVTGLTLSAGTYNVTLGGGGSGGDASAGTNNTEPPCSVKDAPYGGNQGTNGTDAVFGATSPTTIKVTAKGGGGGGSGPNAGNADCGGSAGGQGSGGSNASPAAEGNQPAQNNPHDGTVTNYGYDGGSTPGSPPFTGAGGGGAGAVGSNGSSGGPGVGGAGVDLGPAGWDAPLISYPGINPTSGIYGGGGSGGRAHPSDNPVVPGPNGGGSGGNKNTAAVAGLANGSGGGGGAGTPVNNGNFENGAGGGAGLVVVRYTV